MRQHLQRQPSTAAAGASRPDAGAEKTSTTTLQDSIDSSLSPSPSPSPSASFHNLPPEILLAISKHLIYPDALSLKHSCRYLYVLVDTGVRLKIDWLIERRSLHLECPNDRRCDLGSDLKFCRGSVRLLMQRRREHLECETRPGVGCLVYGTAACTHRRARWLGERWRRWPRARLTVEVWWVAVGVAAVVVAWLLSAAVVVVA
ncbi:F-box and WD-40 domain protein 9 [Microdochium nivale]|nr:F-box and WD-40 domain protein 9 [Microdochium nivale]